MIDFYGFINDIQTFNFNDKTTTYYVVNGDPWLNGNDVSSILCYARLGKAIIEHIPDLFLKII